MPFVVKPPSDDGASFALAPEGNHQGVCCDVVDLGEQEEEWQGQVKMKHKCRLIWEIDEVDEDTGHRFTVSRKYTVSLHENAALRKLLKSWFGKDLSEEQAENGVDLEKLIGCNCMLNVVHNTPGDRTFANVETVTRLGKGMKKIEVSKDYVRVKDRPPLDGETLEQLGVSQASHSWMIGNSIRSDVNPALEIGANAILIEIEDPWHHDEVAPIRSGFPIVRSLSEAARLLLA